MDSSMLLQKNWPDHVVFLCDTIRNVPKQVETGMIINSKQCLVLCTLADCIKECALHWRGIICKNDAWYPAFSMAFQLCRILRNGLQLIKLCCSVTRILPVNLVSVILDCPGQLNEIIDDATEYAHMINRFVLHFLKPSSSAFQKQKKFMNQVTSQLSCLKSSVQAASQDDIIALKDSQLLEKLKIESHAFNSLVSGLLQGLEEPTEIKEDDLCMEENEQEEAALGTVKHAMWHNILPVAVKDLSSFDHLIHQLTVYKKVLKHADSPHIAQILGSSRRNKLVLETTDKDLKGLLEEGGFDMIQSVELMHQIAKAMRHLHSMDVIHGDLKPSNLLVKAQWEYTEWGVLNGNLLIKLADLGVSGDNFETVTHKNMQGNLMSEMLEGKQKYTREADVHSFGLICSQLVTSNAGKLDLARNRDWQDLPEDNIPAKLKTLIQSCIGHDDGIRPSFEVICDTFWLVKEEILARCPEKIEESDKIGCLEIWGSALVCSCYCLCCLCCWPCILGFCYQFMVE